MKPSFFQRNWYFFTPLIVLSIPLLMGIYSMLTWGYGFSESMTAMMKFASTDTRYATGFSESQFARIVPGLDGRTVYQLIKNPFEGGLSDPVWKYTLPQTEIDCYHERTLHFEKDNNGIPRVKKIIHRCMKLPPHATLPLLLLASLGLASCQQGPRIKGLPKKLPIINLHGSPNTPPHSMARQEYPFDANGDYKTTWAAGRDTEESSSSSGSTAPGSDFSSWQSSHEGAPTPEKDYTPPPPKKKKTVASSSKKKSSSSKTSSKGGSYTIKSGDTLGAIAARNGTTVAKIKAANGLSSDLIRAGKTLKIPK
jgi:LysM repeat protein